MSKVTFLGGGSFGTALAILLAQKGVDVSIWDRDAEVIEDINKNRRNAKYLKDVTVPQNVTAYSDMRKALTGDQKR